MKHPRTTFSILATAAMVALGALCAPAHAQADFPTRKPITVVVPFAPGGGNDILARVIGPKLSQILKQTVIIENKPGAGGSLGTEYAARATPDGYTLLIASNQVTIDPALGVKAGYKIERDFAPVGRIASVPMVLVAHNGEPYKTLPEFISYVKAHPGKVAYGSPGNGTPQHLAGEVFASAVKSPMTHVPYKGTSPVITDLIGGQTQVAFATLASVLQYVENGKLTALGIAGQEKSAALPKVPTFGEAGLKNYEAALWYSLVVPASTPQPIVNTLNKALREAMDTPAVDQQLIKLGFVPKPTTPEELKGIITADLAHWARVVKDNNIKVEQ
ncbi:tripartite tricarboxylate transporter substrate binding protein [Variovorax sp. J22R133]|uniref:Bug family tripartite tricarboxylate transporter substrate binding protein n=1 Tax=Variovorax brevis TaxID=3053503 RepID=UPI0025774CC0|nr:tripartite tricarboxylate transporter substrate binding protein [Variovorax sp. J22R133]MDM0117055.1 tripartite tricarboxylate transporter substrate binding protein [Variovorax sp. J22R133]